MDIEQAKQIVRTLKRFECRDLTFGDAEVFLEDNNKNQIGGGYFDRGEGSLWFNYNGTSYSFLNSEAYELRYLIPVGGISRNDNNGEW